MKRALRYAKKESILKTHKKECILALVLIVLAVIVTIVAVSFSDKEQDPTLENSETSSVSVKEESEDSKVEVQESESSQIKETEVFEPHEELASLYSENKDVYAWMKIEGTKIDYPVMYTPDDPEKYLRLDINGNYSVAGNLFIDANCKTDPESDNLIIYGHNMQDGTMFRDLLKYADEEYYKEHPTVEVYTMTENREYEILAAFYDRVYYKSEDCFKFYKFIDAENEESFNEAFEYYIDNSEYDTGVNAEFGDKLITLVTCSYHHEYGRFVVVAREITAASDS